MKKEVSSICLFLCWLAVLAQPQFRFQNFDTRDGLSHSHASSLYMDRKGFLWIGTEFGLNRFDGVNFEQWFHEPGDSTSLLHNRINNITEDKHGRLWIATEKGISIYNTRTGRFTSFRIINTQNNGIISLLQPGVFCDSDGDIWIGTATGSAVLYTSATKKFFDIPLSLAPADRMQNKYVGGFLQDHKKRIWVATSYGNYQLNKHTLKATSFRMDERQPNGPLLNTCTQLFETRKGLLISGTWNAGFLIFDEGKNSFRPFQNTNGPFLPGAVVFNFGQYDNTVFFGTLEGIYVCAEEDLRSPDLVEFTRLPSGPSDPVGIISQSVDAILTETVADKLWIAGDRGLSLLNQDYTLYKTFLFDSFPKHKNAFPKSIEQTGNQLWVGINNELIVFDLETEKFKEKTLPVLDGGFYRFIKSGQHFYQPARNILYEYDETLQHSKTIRELHPDGWPLNINRAMRDSRQNIWVVTSRYGLKMHDTGGNIFSFLHDSTKEVHSVGDIIGDIVESKNGNIYAGGKELYVLRKNEDVFEAISILGVNEKNEIRALTIEDHVLWIGSRNGLYSYDEQTEIVRHHELPPKVNDLTEGLEKDDDGKIWLVTPSGLVCYDPVEASTKVFNEKTGWPGSFSVICKLEDGRLAAGVEGGILLINPDEIIPSAYSPAPLITRLVIDEEIIFLLPGSDTTYRLKHHQSIRFDYVSLTYHDAADNKYAWQLKGYDDQWHSTDNLMSQPFATLAPGKYTFTVKSARANNPWSEQVAAINFMVLPPFYRTWWFIVLIAALIGGIFYLFYRTRLQKALQIERMRTRIATDLHDDIGSTLSSISFYSEAVHQRTKNNLPEVSPILEKMGETSRMMVSSMSDIVWAINPLNDDMGKMLDRMQSYAKELAAIKEKVIEVVIDEKVHHLKPKLEQRRNIYLIYKEALNNALKYADGMRITIHVTLNRNLFEMKIEDDGQGFDIQKEHEGNGIKNMQRRASDIGANLKIHTEAGKGTFIHLLLEI